MSIMAAVIALGLGGSPALPPGAGTAPSGSLVLVQGRPDAPGYGVQPQGYGDPQSNGATPNGYGTSQGYGDRPTDYGVPPAGYGAPPSGYGRGLDQYGKAPGYGVQPPSYGLPPPGSGVSPGYGARPEGYGVAPGYGQAPSGYGQAPGYGSVPREPPSPPARAAIGRGGQNAGITVPPAVPGIQYRYDQAGNFLGATETVDNTTREYDAQGRVTRTFVRDGRRVVVFDAAGHAIQRSGGE
jgi:YD repeat-containing protein